MKDLAAANNKEAIPVSKEIDDCKSAQDQQEKQCQVEISRSDKSVAKAVNDEIDETNNMVIISDAKDPETDLMI